MIGGLIMCHGDDAGLRVPPRVAAVQVVVLVVRDDDDATVAAEATRLCGELNAAGVRTRLDASTNVGFGRRATAWELKGVPIRVELGPRDIEGGVATIARRDGGDKTTVALSELTIRLPLLLEEIQSALLAAATARRDALTVDVGSIEDAVEAAQTGFARIEWARVGAAGEAELAKSSMTVRCLVGADGDVAEAEDSPGNIAYVARSY